MKTLKTVRRVLSFAKPYRAYLLGALLCAVATVCLTLLGPVLVGNAIDFIIAESQVDFESVGKILLGLLLAIAGTALFQWLMTLCTNAVSYYTVRDLRQTLFQKLNAVPLKYIDAHPHGDLISRVVNDIDAVGDGLLQGITQLFSGLITNHRHACLYARHQLQNRRCCRARHTAVAFCCGIYCPAVRENV